MSTTSTFIRQGSLLKTFVLYTKLFHKPFTHEALMAGLPMNDLETSQELFSLNSSKSLFSRVARRAGLKSALIQRDIKNILELQLPMILLLTNDYTCIMEAFSKDKKKVKIIYPDNGALEEWVEVDKLEKEYLGYAFMLKKEFEYEDISTLQMKQKYWFFDTIKLSKNIYKDVILASLLINLFVLATPLFTMNVYDRVIPNNAQETLFVFSIGIIFIYILDFFLKFIRSSMLETAGKKSDVIMSSIIFEKVLDLKMNVHPASVGSFANNLKNFESVRSFFTSATMSVIIDMPFSLIFLFVIYYIGGNLVFVPMITMILIISYAVFLRKPLERSIKASHEANAKKNAILIESLHNIETIKTMSLAGKIQWKWEEATGEIAEKNYKSRLLSSSIPNVTGFLTQLNTVFIIIFGVYMIQEFELTMGGLIAVIILTSRTVAPMGQMASLISNYSDAKSSYDTLNTIITQPLEREPGHSFLQRPTVSGTIEFKNVTFSYPNSDVIALNNVSFTINAGEKVAIIGRIGSGKSTITKLILKLYDPDQGTILLDGIDIAQIDPEDIRRSISYVPQDIHLFRGTLKENIISSQIHPSDEDVVRASTISGASEFIHTHPKGYDMPIGERGNGLSGGQRQSIGIARAFLQDAPIILMDEPTNAMDTTSEKQLIININEEVKEKTMILITQKLTLLSLAQRIIVMDKAELLLDGSKEYVTKKLQSRTHA